MHNLFQKHMNYYRLVVQQSPFHAPGDLNANIYYNKSTIVHRASTSTCNNATFGTSDGQRRRLSSNTGIRSGVSGSGGVDIENGDQAALGLLTGRSAAIDEGVDVGGGNRS
jgi:hypothetical protein